MSCHADTLRWRRCQRAFTRRDTLMVGRLAWCASQLPWHSTRTDTSVTGPYTCEAIAPLTKPSNGQFT